MRLCLFKGNFSGLCGGQCPPARLPLAGIHAKCDIPQWLTVSTTETSIVVYSILVSNTASRQGSLLPWPPIYSASERDFHNPRLATAYIIHHTSLHRLG